MAGNLNKILPLLFLCFCAGLLGRQPSPDGFHRPYGLGNSILALDEQRPSQEQEHSHSARDRDLRAAFYGTLISASLVKYLLDRRQPSPEKFTIFPLVRQNPHRMEYGLRLDVRLLRGEEELEYWSDGVKE
ncbi:MAG: hypothetical protein ACE5D1_01290 [Fidelibacterota bacterium]